MIRISAFADEISQDPVEQVDVLTRHGIKAIEFRAIHGTNVLDLTDAQHAEFRGLLAARGFGLSAIGSPIGKIRITEPFERAPRAVRAGHGPGRLLPGPADPGLQLLHAAGRRPGLASRRGDPTAWPSWPVARPTAGSPCSSRTRRGSTATPPPASPTSSRRSIPRRCGTPSTRPITSRSASRSTRPGPGSGTSSGISTSRTTTRSSSATCRPAPATARSPACSQEAVDAGYDGFCVLEPHLDHRRALVGLHGPGTVRRGRRRPQGHPRRAEDRLRVRRRGMLTRETHPWRPGS